MNRGGMVELVDTPDSKSGSLRRVSVQVRLPLPIYGTFQEWKCVNVCVSKFETPTHIDLQRDGMDSKFIVFYK